MDLNVPATNSLLNENRLMTANANSSYLSREYHRLCQIVFDYEKTMAKKQSKEKWDGMLSDISETFLKRFCDTFFIPNFSKELMYFLISFSQNIIIKMF